MKSTSRPVISATALALSISNSVYAATIVWDNDLGGGDGMFGSATNWVGDTLPGGGDVADINGAFTVDRSSITVDQSNINGGATLNISSGTFSDSRAGNTRRTFVGNSGDGTVNMSGGSWNIGHVLAVGGAGDGVFNLSGGSLAVSRGGNSLAGNPNTFGGSNGGSITVGYGTGTGLFSVTGGALETRIGTEVGDNGTFQVLGSAASSIGIGSSGSLDGHWWQDAGGILSIGIDGGGVTPIFIDDSGSGTTDPYVHFVSGSILDLSFSGTAPERGSWTILELEGQDIDDQGLILSALSAADPFWSFSVDNSGANGLLIATYSIPEPSLPALIFGGFTVIAFRRRRS